MKKQLMLLLSLLALAGCATSGGRSGADQIKNVNASARIHTELAGAYYARAQLGIALGEIATALQADPNYAPAYNMRGLVNMTLREYKEAEQDFQHSLQLDKDDSDTHNNYGWFLCQRGREKESIPHFMAALKNPLYDTPERAYLNAGLCAKKIGENKDAEEFLQRALVVQPDLLEAMLALAELNFGKGNYVVAKKYFSAYSAKKEELTAEQLWLAVRIERKVGDRNSEASYALQLRKRYPDSPEAQLLASGE